MKLENDDRFDVNHGDIPAVYHLIGGGRVTSSTLVDRALEVKFADSLDGFASRNVSENFTVTASDVSAHAHSHHVMAQVVQPVTVSAANIYNTEGAYNITANVTNQISGSTVEASLIYVQIKITNLSWTLENKGMD